MKKLILISILGVFLFTLTSCDNGDDSNGGFPSSTQAFMTDLDHFLMVYTDGSRDELVVVSWHSSIEPIDYELRFGDNEAIDVTWYTYDEEDWSAYLVLAYEEVDVNELGEIDFFVSMNNQDFQGVLQLVSPLSVSFGDFSWDENYNLTWEIASKPELYWVSATFECYLEDDDIYKIDDWQISGDKTSFSISKSIYNSYEDCDYYDFYVSLQAINYYRQGRFLIYSLSQSDIEFGDYKENLKPAQVHKISEMNLARSNQ
ncbi:MAG: hypothetical protein K9N06_12655 [Candidatus Cloacimonetes bacterium]|nr:hypothetical protein [Candidatus Cloacimonadota bacterium]